MAFSIIRVWVASPLADRKMRYRITFGLWLRVSAEGPSCEVVSPLMRNSLIQDTPLRQGSDIRSVVLHPGSGSDVVSGDVEEDQPSRKSQRSFEALSYVWGDASGTKIINIERADISVTKSLEAALRHLRYHDRPTSDPVWQHHPQTAVQAGLADVLGRPWSQRMWVVQEIGRSRSALLICGDHGVTWSTMWQRKVARPVPRR
ncbi:HET domain-containing protein [Microdochium nivale]|nr:HET domain-containing protein [Microdochium nivale]